MPPRFGPLPYLAACETANTARPIANTPLPYGRNSRKRSSPRATAGTRAFWVRARTEIRFWVAQATGLYRPATRRAERGSHPNPIKKGLWEAAALLFRSASRRPARAEIGRASCRERAEMAGG